MGRLGNQMFQYSFLRSQAQRLGVKFYCPTWLGDSMFELEDDSERHLSPLQQPKEYHEPLFSPGFNAQALLIEDNTDISGYFQSWRYLDHHKTNRWFKFRASVAGEARGFIKSNKRSPIAAIHIRLGDYLDEYQHRYYVARRFYFERAIAPIAKSHRILVFSDDPSKARDYIGKSRQNVVFMEGMSVVDDLYIMANADTLVCSPSTLSWWAAWLGHRPGRLVIVPSEGPFRPGAQYNNKDYWYPEWRAMNALTPLVDHILVKRLCYKIQRSVRF